MAQMYRRRIAKKMGVSYPVSYKAVFGGKEKARRKSFSRRAFRMSGRLDSNQRPPEPHSRSQGRSQPQNVANASLLMTYRLHSSHTLRRSQPRINDSPIFSRVFRAQACPATKESRTNVMA